MAAAQLVLPSLKRLMIKFDGDADAGGCWERGLATKIPRALGCCLGTRCRCCHFTCSISYAYTLLPLAMYPPRCAGDWLRGASGLEELSLYCSSLTLTGVLGGLTKVQWSARRAPLYVASVLDVQPLALCSGQLRRPKAPG